MLMYLMFLESDEEKKTFEQIYKDNYLYMYHVAFKMLGQQMDAENAVHETFLSIAEHYKKYSKLSCREMTGLCVTIVKHKSIDILRKARHLSDEEVEKLVLYNETKEYEPEVIVEQREEKQKLIRIMKQMPETLRIVLDLKYFYDYSNREIAKILEISNKTVEMRMYRAKIKMRELLEHEENM